MRNIFSLALASIFLVLLLIEETTEQTTNMTTTANTTTYTTTTRTTTSPTTPKSRRKKSKRRRSTSITTTKKTVVTKDPYIFHQQSLLFWLTYLEKFRLFYCEKLMECRNDHLYFERSKYKVCGRDYFSRDLVWFDHKCSLWAYNCKGLGMFFHKKKELCLEANPKVDKFVNEDYLDPPRVVQLKLNKYSKR